MIIKAKFESMCEFCQNRIEIGELIQWEKGEPALHKECAEDRDASALSPIQPVQKGVTVRFNPPKGNANV